MLLLYAYSLTCTQKIMPIWQKAIPCARHLHRHSHKNCNWSLLLLNCPQCLMQVWSLDYFVNKYSTQCHKSKVPMHTRSHSCLTMPLLLEMWFGSIKKWSQSLRCAQKIVIKFQLVCARYEMAMFFMLLRSISLLGVKTFRLLDMITAWHWHCEWNNNKKNAETNRKV